MGPDEIKGDPGFDQPWYYRLELGPGIFTKGKDRPNLALTRALLRKVNIEPGTRCLDVGCEEGVVSILLDRRGADVVAYDRVYSEERLSLVREALDTRFELVGRAIRNHTDNLWLGRGGPTPGIGMPLSRLPHALLKERGDSPFDVVVFSGVLYHVYDPLAALAFVRGCLRNGGIMIVETAALFTAHLVLHLNGRSRFTPLSVWVPSVGCLDYMLRLVRLEPIDLLYYGGERGRIAVACRAVDAPPGDRGDEWIGSPLHDYELAEYLDWPGLSVDGQPVGYARAEERIQLIDVLGEIPPYRPEREEMRLLLDAKM